MKDRAPVARIEAGHHFLGAAECADRKTTADNFAEHREIGFDVENLLRTALVKSERDHFIEDEQRPGAMRRFGHSPEKSRRRLDYARRAEHWLKENRGDFRAALREQGLECGRLAKIRKHRALAVLSAEANFQIVVGAVISVARHQDKLAAGEPARDLSREHPGFRSRIAESHPIDRRDSL